MKTKITSIALLVLAGLFRSTESAKAYIHMPDDLTWDANVGIFPVITQPAAAYYSAQRASESALSAYEAATSAYNAATSAYNAALDNFIYSSYNDPDSGVAAFAAFEAATATKISTQAALYVAQATYNQSLANVNAATSADPFSSFHIAVYSSQKIFNLALGANQAPLIAYYAASAAYYAAEADYLSSFDYNDPSRTEAAFATFQAADAIFQAADATRISTQASYDQSVTTLRAAVSSANAAAVPEPSTYGLIGIGALGVAFAARRRKLKKA